MHRPIHYITPTLQIDALSARERISQFEQAHFQEQERSMGMTAVLIIFLGVLVTFCAMLWGAA